MSADSEGARLSDVQMAEEFDAFVNADTVMQPGGTTELTRDQIMQRLSQIEEQVRTLARTLRRQEIEIQNTRLFVESIPVLISGLRREIATDIATRKLGGEGHIL